MNEYEKLQQKCKEVKISLSEACRLAGVDRKSIQRWSKRNPKSVTILRQLEEVISQKTINQNQ